MSYERAARLGVLKELMVRKAFVAYVKAGGMFDISVEVCILGSFFNILMVMMPLSHHFNVFYCYACHAQYDHYDDRMKHYYKYADTMWKTRYKQSRVRSQHNNHC